MVGFALVVLASVFFCIQNVVVRILFAEQALLGIGTTGGFLAPTLQNSFLLLLMRMVLAVPLMGLLSSGLYPKIWADLRQLLTPAGRRGLIHTLAGGGLMFAYLALLYVSIGLIATGIALTLFFTFPVFTALISWKVFGHRPSRLSWAIMAGVLVGSTLTVPASQWSGGGSFWGALLAILSGVTYALYTVNAQKGFGYLHPVPFTWANFAVALLLSGICVGLWPYPNSGELLWGPIWIGSLVSGFVTFVGHMLYNSGIRVIGATAAAMVGSANPAFTVLLAWVTIGETFGALQLAGIGLVTLSVISLSLVSSKQAG